VIGRGSIRTVVLVLALTSAVPAVGQEIDFGSFYGGTVAVYVESDLNFGTLIRPWPSVVNLGDDEMGVVSLDGFMNLDVLVVVTQSTPGYLHHVEDLGTCAEDTCRVALDLEVAYANRPPFPGPHNATPITGTSVRFRLRERGAGEPPRPPPTPRHEGFVPPEATAFLYFYGTAVPPVDSKPGDYSATVTVTVEYL
jgi:hypothetical protein